MRYSRHCDSMLCHVPGWSLPSYYGESPWLTQPAGARGDAWHFRAWTYALTIGQPLPTLPLCLADNLAVPLELEASYEETCRIRRIP